MSREIRFRAWWIKDDFGEAKGIMLHNVHDFYDTLGDKRHGNEYEPESSFGCLLDKPDEYIVMQYTGLSDKNGVDIYEGDIIVEGGKYGLKNHAMKMIHAAASDDMGVDMYGYYDVGGSCEVVGNIYENPELLTNTSN